ncbi:MAG: type III-B CRISPR module RAMP protein Cmr6 [Isosphaerales bacterium]
MRSPIIALKNNRDRGQHAGLLLQRYLAENATGEQGNPEEKRAILHAAIKAAASNEVRALYQLAFARWSSSLPTDPPPADLVTSGRLIIGLGSENVLETGIRLHHTYGMPIIPGSALKGLAAHYCDQVWSVEDDRFKKPTPEEDQAYRGYLQGKGSKPDENFHRLLFGTTDDSGCIVFHDSWLTSDSPKPLVLDVMTPHHPKWNDVKNPVAPTDFDSPTPVPFLSVTGTFRVAVSWRGPASDKTRCWTELALSLLQDALKDWGVGGKTTSGYGRLTLPPPPPPPPRPKKRASGEKAKVKIIAARPKGGFNVQDVELGRNPGTLTVGSPPPGVDTSPESIVDVLVHNDDSKTPQYRWPQVPKK